MQRSNATCKVSRKSKPRKPKAIPLEPPKIEGLFFCRLLLRFQKQSSADATIFWRSLANLLIVSTSTTSGYVIYTSFKPKSLTCYAPAALQTSAAGYLNVPLTMAFYGGEPIEDSSSLTITNRKFYSDIPTTSRGVSVRAKFPKPYVTYDVFGIVAATSSPAVCLISGPNGTIVDLEVVCKIFGDDRTTLPKTSTTAGATSQVPYFNYLDASNSTGAAGSQLLKPINVQAANVNAQAWL